jgi:hypothetical protein
MQGIIRVSMLKAMMTIITHAMERSGYAVKVKMRASTRGNVTV